MASKTIYRVIFHNKGKVYELYAHSVGDGGIMGFVQIEELIFGEHTQVVVDPSEEKLKSEFAGVKRSFIPMHSIIRVDEVEKEGHAKISDAEGGNVTPFPVSMYGPGRGGNDPGQGN
ncbi:hypothetical protein KBTX_03246 [wastewater metagenome]|uniref:DUF1820 domain-containing protein n=2 Tax=unclassified sequences TaxID=12908 RepID=A0A5B8RFV4_9ZZZZ|nr:MULTISPECIES: DUF1820 family protein [Arhodomonas]MCS4504363.1 DUF1820 family protein [Arhodomonas aquaeolei]QEA06903.1 hypothetical protein KBTEX_03246 [uncultured organism]